MERDPVEVRYGLVDMYRRGTMLQFSLASLDELGLGLYIP